ncbi:MAG: hypothetical protein R3Y51_06185 [Rikenellaceae bacterium]
MAGFKFTAFQRNKPRQFNYEPRYYDPKKEERDARQRALGIIEEDEKDKKYVPGSYIRSKRIQRMLGVENKPKKNNALRVALVRFAIAITLLIALCYFIINFKGLEKLLELVQK